MIRSFANRIISVFMLPVVLAMLAGCDDYFLISEGRRTGNIPAGFSIEFGDSVIIGPEDMEYYDFSTHIIYLKNNDSPLKDFMGYGTFTVRANKEKIYSGTVHPGYSSTMPTGPFIRSVPSGYPDFVIRIEYMAPYDTAGQGIYPDPRPDPRIIESLRKDNLFHEGISCMLENARQTSSGKISFTYTVTNHDSYNYLILSPNSMGIDLFHYYTTGLIIRIPGTEWLHYERKEINPEPWNSWKSFWFEILRAGASRTYTITYSVFPPVTPGIYKVDFEFPGLYHVSREEINQRYGRIWLGDIRTSGSIDIP